MARVFVDTNVLFPFSVMDLMLALTEDDIHEVIWTETLLREWQQAPDSPDYSPKASVKAALGKSES